MMKVLDQNKKTMLLKNQVLQSDEVAQEFLKSELIIIPKKAKAIKFSDYRTICIRSHGIKLLLKIILKRLTK